ncbi:MAG: GNAT family N-acetyltransferase [Leptolyngbya sp. SIO1E4]|nr:GNAT family N-acetyltransferase [Leptolyngbya sp. SIO1E4]
MLELNGEFGWMIHYRQATEQDREALFELHKLALGPYIDQIFGWNEAVQKQFFNDRFDANKLQWIVGNGLRVGVIAYQERDTGFYLESLEIYPAYQGKGYGSAAIQDIIQKAQRRSLPVELQVFKINPAIRLYRRLGFSVVNESDRHIQMRRMPEVNSRF